MAGSPKKAEAIELSIPFDRTEYDIDTEIPVKISVSPYGSVIDDMEYLSDSSAVFFADSVINTGKTEGDYSFYVCAGDIENNVLSIHVVDITARNVAAQKAEEERLAKEAEKQRAAEEQAAREAEEKTTAEQTVSDTASVLPETEPAPASQPTEEPMQIVEEQVQEVPISGTAYLSATGSKYHSIDHCGKMNPSKARKTTVLDAEAAGYGRCSKCWQSIWTMKSAKGVPYGYIYTWF